MMWEDLLAALVIGGISALVASALATLVAAPLLTQARLEFRVRLLEMFAAAVRRELPLGQAVAAALEDHGRLPLARRRALRKVLDELARGAALSEALALGAPAWFPPRVVAAVRAAEGGPDLAGALDAAAREGIDARAIADRAQLSALYPALVLTVIAGVAVFVNPRFIAIGEGMRLSGKSAEAIAAGALAGEIALWAFVLGGGLVAALALLRAGLGRAHFEAFTSRVVPRLPIVRRLLLLPAAERLCRTLAPLVRAGMPLPAALRRAAPAAGVPFVARSAEDAADAVEAGTLPEEALGALEAPRFVRARAAAAAASGKGDRLAAALEGIAGDCARRARLRAERLAGAIYPTSVVVLGGMVFLHFRAVFVLGNDLVRSTKVLW